MIASTPSSATRTAGRLHRGCRRAGTRVPPRGPIGENFPWAIAAPRAIRRCCCSQTGARGLRRDSSRSFGPRRGGRIPSSQHRGAWRLPARSTEANGASGRALAFQLCGEVVHGTSAGASSAFRPPTSSPPRRSAARPRRLRVPRRRPVTDRAVGGGEHRRASTFQHREEGELIEAFISDFDGDLYGRLALRPSVSPERVVGGGAPDEPGVVEQNAPRRAAPARWRRRLAKSLRSNDRATPAQLRSGLPYDRTTERKREITAKFGANEA